MSAPRPAHCSHAGAVGPEYSRGANPPFHELIHEKFPVVDGQVEVPDRPGLGITVDEDLARRRARA